MAAAQHCGSSLQFSLVLAAILGFCGALQTQANSSVADLVGQRIANGKPTSTEKIPWQIYMRSRKTDGSENWVCGASIISDMWIMSAAHCFAKTVNTAKGWEIEVTRIYFYPGLTNTDDKDDDSFEQNTIIEEGDIETNLFIHKDYTKGGSKYNNDIALIKLNKALKFTSRIQKIDLATANDFRPGKKAIVSGWGVTEDGSFPDVLRYVDNLNLISHEDCIKNWGANGHLVTDHMVCHQTRRKGHCGGDSGGPLVTGKGASNGPPYVQIGVVSWSSTTCGSGLPEVYVSVSAMNTWIEETISNNVDCVDIQDERNCLYWSSEDNRYGMNLCTTGPYVAWMATNCKKTCNKCGKNVVNGGWSVWTDWSECDTDCQQMKMRLCNSPTPSGGGADCVGDATESRACTGGRCAVNGGWSAWAAWSDCDKDCQQMKMRLCNNPTPSGGGADCVGGATESRACTGGSCVNVDCVDKQAEGNCLYWASEDNQYGMNLCTTGPYVAWMSTNCKKTCNKCGSQK